MTGKVTWNSVKWTPMRSLINPPATWRCPVVIEVAVLSEILGKVYFNGIPGTFGEMYSSRWLPGDVPWKPQGWALMEPTMVFNCKCLGRNEAGPPSVIRTNGQGILPSYCHAQEEETSFCKILISDDSTVVMICLEPLGPEVSLRPHSFKRVKNFDTCD